MTNKLTRQSIEQARTINSGYTQKQLAVWGISWPPKKGWKKLLLQRIDDDKT